MFAAAGFDAWDYVRFPPVADIRGVRFRRNLPVARTLFQISNGGMKLTLPFAAGLLLTGCGNGQPLERADYMLQWYPRASSDYGELVPGFKSLSMCRRAGSGKTIAEYGGLVSILAPEGSKVRLPREDGPWFECMTKCRPHMEGSYLLVCQNIVEFRGIDTLSPH